MKAAIPEYMKFGAVREMHQQKAAGTEIEATVQEDGRTFFKAHIVDAEAVKKVNAGFYKGFSISGKVTTRDELNKATVTGETGRDFTGWGRFRKRNLKPVKNYWMLESICRVSEQIEGCSRTGQNSVYRALLSEF